MPNLSLRPRLGNRRGGAAAPPVDPDAGIAAILADGAHMALDTTLASTMWIEDTKFTQVTAAGNQVGALLTRFGTTQYNFANSNSDNRPLWDGVGALSFDGSTDLLASTDAVGFLNAAPGFTFGEYIYVQAVALSGLFGISTTTNNAARAQARLNADGSISFDVRRLDADTVSTFTSAPGVITAAGFYLIMGDVDFPTGAARLWLDGELVASGTISNPGAATSATNSARFRVGQSVAGSGQFQSGKARRLVLARKTFSDADRETLGQWIATGGLVNGAYYIADAARSWFSDDTVILDGSKAYIGAAREGSLPSLVKSFDLTTKQARTVHVTTTALAGGDDHNEPAILKLSNGSFAVGSVAHNVDTFELARGSSMTGLTEAAIASQLATVNMSYCNLFQHEGAPNAPLYIFGRGGSPWSARYSKSSDLGVTWSAYTIWAENGANRPYVKYCKVSSTRTVFILTEGHPDTLTTSVYAGYFENDLFYKMDGTALGSLPINPASFTLIFDGTSTGGSWIWDLKYIGGKMIAAVSSFPTLTAHRYHIVEFDASGVTVDPEFIEAGTNLYTGSPNYSGGIAIHPTNKAMVYASVGGTGAHQIYPYTRSGLGAWSQGAALTSGSPRSFRPKTVPGLLTFIRGTYTSYTNFPDCKIMGMLIA